jgi:hypothetical protein
MLLPLRSNAGTPFPRSVFDQVSKTLTDRFGGLTAYTRAPASSAWQDDDGHVKKDDIVVYGLGCRTRSGLVERLPQNLGRTIPTGRDRDLCAAGVETLGAVCSLLITRLALQNLLSFDAHRLKGRNWFWIKWRDLPTSASHFVIPAVKKLRPHGGDTRAMELGHRL